MGWVAGGVQLSAAGSVTHEPPVVVSALVLQEVPSVEAEIMSFSTLTYSHVPAFRFKTMVSPLDAVTDKEAAPLAQSTL